VAGDVSEYVGLRLISYGRTNIFAMITVFRTA